MITADEAGVLLAEAVQLMGTLEAACIQERPPGEPLPRGLLTCGEAARIVPAVVLLVLELFPVLLEAGVLEQALRSAALNSSGGVYN